MKRIAAFDGPMKLEGFNNLTKALNFNLYDFCVARSESEQQSYIQYIYDRYNAKRITRILEGICDIIAAKVLSVSNQDYDPWGASCLLLMSDIKGSGVGDVSMHLDKSHICAHTYPDFRKEGQICTFRVDINISTCGEISPLKALNYMFEAFESDVVVVDYVVRGYTRDVGGKRIFMDHAMHSIQDYIDPHILADYHCVDLTLQSENIWQTKMIRTRLDESSYFIEDVDLANLEVRKYIHMVREEMRGTAYMWSD